MKEKQEGKKRNIGSVGLIGLLGVGDTVYFYNRWENFHFPEIIECFEMMTTLRDIKKLKVGDIIWADKEPYTMRGKVYGYTCEQVEKIEKEIEWIESKRQVNYRVYYSDGYIVFPDIRTIYKLTDPDRFFNLLRQEKYAQALKSPWYC